ncbi:BTAD domain-containing putative transcriptional regulator [Actinosynnema sp. NPDC020468]|uniref:AfsR/SARP family transcriptional regulator n=1 Tax=Actinosynnema sp. NPDC020468 TaxID=3154488 RepID=UPI0033C3670C
MLLRLLGEVAVHVHGHPVDPGPARQRCVLAALAVDAGRVVPVDRLVERVWGVDAPRRARATLHSYVSRLRRVLAEADAASRASAVGGASVAAGVAGASAVAGVAGVGGAGGGAGVGGVARAGGTGFVGGTGGVGGAEGSVVIVRRSGGYALVSAEPVVDLGMFRALRDRAGDGVDPVRVLGEALALWRGEALTGLDGEWAEAERERLGRERVAAQHDLVDARLRAGQGGGLVAELAGRVVEHPLDERVAGQYLLALYRVGRVGDALEHHRAFRERLVEELGVDPGPALQELHRRILVADPGLAGAAPGQVTPGLPTPGRGVAGQEAAGRQEVAGQGVAGRGAVGQGGAGQGVRDQAALEHDAAGQAALVAAPGQAAPVAAPGQDVSGQDVSGQVAPAVVRVGVQGQVVVPVVVPRELPAAPSAFVGRQDELDRLDVALSKARDGATVAISAVGGAGGIGKTWLALHWAHRNAELFPDGQLFVDLRGFGPDGVPMSSAVAVRGFLDTLGVDPARIPVEPHAQAALFRSLVAGRRVLLVLDNAADTAQVTPLLPGSATCTVLVTSRRRLPGLTTTHAAHQLALDVLSDAEARALLTERLGADRVAAERAAVGELVALCGGFPLALGIVAGHARVHERLPLAESVAALREFGLDALDDDPAAGLPTVLSWSRRGLTPDQATVFALLGDAPGPDIGVPAAVALTGLPAADVRAALRGLEQASLITRHASGRYRMHDLIRAYAAAEVAEDVRAAALRRVLDFYTRTAHAADRLLDPHRQAVEPGPTDVRPHPLADGAQALAWFHAEHPNLLAAHQVAVARGWHDLVWLSAWTLTAFHYRRGHRHDRLAVWRSALEVAHHLPDPAVLVRTHRFLGVAYADLGRHEEATDHLSEALALAERHDDAMQQALTHRMLAQAWGERDDDHRALHHAIRSLRLLPTTDPVGRADALNQVGWYEARTGAHDAARAHCAEALTLHRAHDNRPGEAATLDSLGYLDHLAGRHHRAVEHYREAHALYAALDNTYECATTLDNLAHPYAALNLREQARDTWRQAHDLYRAQGRDAEADLVRRHLDALDRG